MQKKKERNVEREREGRIIDDGRLRPSRSVPSNRKFCSSAQNVVFNLYYSILESRA